MTGTDHFEPLDAVIEEYVATYSDGWKPKTAMKYRAEFRDLLEWLVVTERPTTTASLDFATLYAYCNHLKQKPAVRGVWRGDRRALPPPGATAQPRSLNSVNASMRSLRALVLYLFEDGRLSANPFARKHGRGGPNPLLPVAVTPTKGATLRDIEALERGCEGRTPADLRDQAIVALLKTTSARNSSIRLLRVEDVDLSRGVVTFWNAKMARTYETALQPEARAAVVRYLARGRPSFLPRYTVRGYEQVVVGEDPGYLFLARRNGRSQAVGPLTDNGLSTMLNRRYKIGGGTLPSFRSHRIRHGTATLLGNNGMGIDELSRHLGHSTTRLTRRYAVQTTDTIGRLAYGAMAASGLTHQPQRRGRR